MSSALLRRLRRAITGVAVTGSLLTAAGVGAHAIAETMPSSRTEVDHVSQRPGYLSVSDAVDASLEALAADAPSANGHAEAAAARSISRDLPAAAPVPAVPEAFATVDDVVLRVPSGRTEIVGFHEAQPGQLTMTPRGRAVADDSPRYDPATTTEGADYAILASRGRSGSATSAADLALPEGANVASVVTGTVVAVDRYALYGATPDVVVTIAPDADPGIRVRMFHVRDVIATPGDHVRAGATVVARSARRLPFTSQVDRKTTAVGPHVHVEVEAA